VKSLPVIIQLLTVLFLFALSGNAFAADPAAPVSGASVGITSEIINAKLKEVEAAKELDEDTKGTLIELYRKALSNLEKEQASTQAATAFSKARETAPAEARADREELEQLQKKYPTVTLEVTEKTPLADVEQLLINEKANQAAVDAKLAELEKQLTAETERPAAIRQRITADRQRQELISNELEQATPPGELPRLSEARRLSLQAEQLALSAELKMLDQ
jgi:potassium efflux system protein